MNRIFIAKAGPVPPAFYRAAQKPNAEYGMLS